MVYVCLNSCLCKTNIFIEFGWSKLVVFVDKILDMFIKKGRSSLIELVLGPVWECNFNKCDFKNCVFEITTF
jgi:hypothetical protein